MAIVIATDSLQAGRELAAYLVLDEVDEVISVQAGSPFYAIQFVRKFPSPSNRIVWDQNVRTMKWDIKKLASAQVPVITFDRAHYAPEQITQVVLAFITT